MNGIPISGNGPDWYDRGARFSCALLFLMGCPETKASFLLPLSVRSNPLSPFPSGCFLCFTGCVVGGAHRRSVALGYFFFLTRFVAAGGRPFFASLVVAASRPSFPFPTLHFLSFTHIFDAPRHHGRCPGLLAIETHLRILHPTFRSFLGFCLLLPRRRDSRFCLPGDCGTSARILLAPPLFSPRPQRSLRRRKPTFSWRRQEDR